MLVALTTDSGLKAMPHNTYAGKTNAGTVRGDERLLSVQRAQTTDYLLCQLSSGSGGVGARGQAARSNARGPSRAGQELC